MASNIARGIGKKTAARFFNINNNNNNVNNILLKVAFSSVAVAPAPLKKAKTSLTLEERLELAKTKDTPDNKLYTWERKAYDKQVAVLRQQYMEEYKIVKKAKDDKIKEDFDDHMKRKQEKAILKRHKKIRNRKVMVERQKEISERKKEKLRKSQAIRDAKRKEYEKKQTNLINAMTLESKLWINENNIEEKITPALFSKAGNTTGMKTSFSKNFDYLTLSDVPNFEDYSDDELFDEKFDQLHLDKFWDQSWKEDFHINGQNPIMSREYNPDTVVMEDAAYRFSFIGKIRRGEFKLDAEVMNPTVIRRDQLKKTDMKHLSEMCERIDNRVYKDVYEKDATKGYTAEDIFGDDDKLDIFDDDELYDFDLDEKNPLGTDIEIKDKEDT